MKEDQEKARVMIEGSPWFVLTSSARVGEDFEVHSRFPNEEAAKIAATGVALREDIYAWTACLHRRFERESTVRETTMDPDPSGPKLSSGAVSARIRDVSSS